MDMMTDRYGTGPALLMCMLAFGGCTPTRAFESTGAPVVSQTQDETVPVETPDRTCKGSTGHLLLLVEVPVVLQTNILLWLRNLDPSIPEDEKIRSAGLGDNCLFD